jgi:hypothetical protein
VQDTVSCLRTAGSTVSDPVNSPDGTLNYASSYSPPEMADAGPDAPPPDTSKMDAKQTACEDRKAGVGAARRQGLITGAQEESCEGSFSASSYTALPGLSEALAKYKG